MPTYLYCVLTRDPGADPPAPSVRGLDNQPIRILPAGSVEAWVSTVGTVTPAPSVESVRAHDRVVSAALATGRTPLPARFAQTWVSDDRCVASIRERAGELEPLLRRVAGMVEMTVSTILPAVPAVVRPGAATAADSAPGRSYLDSIRAQADDERQRRSALEALRARVSDALGPLSRGELAEVRASDHALTLSLSYLVQRGEEERFREVVTDVARDAAARLVVAGPRAPYSFAPTPRQPGRPGSRRSAEAGQ